MSAAQGNVFNTLQLKIEAAIEDNTTLNNRRQHLGASALGKPCERALWYSFHWLTQGKTSARMKRLFSRGHREEPIVIADLVAAGVEILETQPSRKFANGHAGGSADGIIINVPDAPKTKHLLEIKTSNDRGFKNMKRLGVQKASPTYYAQMQIYMKLFRLKRALFIMVNKNDDARYYERIKYSGKAARLYFAKAQRIVEATSPPPRVSDDPNFYLCKNYKCTFYNACHGQGLRPSRNCRTCNNVDLHDDGGWRCRLKGKFRNYKQQSKGCKSWEVLPTLKSR